MPTTDDATWKVALIAFLARQTITTLDDLPQGPREIDADTLDESLDLDPEALRRFAEQILDLATQIEIVASTLPTESMLLDGPRLRAAAERALRVGIATPEQAMFAARLLPYRHAFSALAHALRSSDAHLTWDDLTIADLLSNPSGATAELAHIVSTRAGLSPSSEISRCTDVQTTALAAALGVAADRDPR